MTTLTFDPNLVRQLREHAAKAPKHSATYGQEKAEPGLWLVGDQGVYLMSNGDPGLMQPDGAKAVVAYANECNPEKMAFDDWWEAKRASFGGDDGVEFIPLASVPENGFLAIKISPEALEIRATK